MRAIYMLSQPHLFGVAERDQGWGKTRRRKDETYAPGQQVRQPFTENTPLVLSEVHNKRKNV